MKSTKNQTHTRQSHEFLPVYDKDSKILILGSFPSVKSREIHFYYGHPQNRFWKLLARLLDCPVPVSIEEKKSMLQTHHIALWDVIDSCEIIGSSDSSIKNVTPSDVPMILQNSQITHVFANGATAGKLYRKYLQEKTGIEAIVLPSTSPANAAYSLDRLAESWMQIGDFL